MIELFGVKYQFPEKIKTIQIIGQTCTGKSSLARAIAEQVMEAPKGVALAVLDDVPVGADRLNVLHSQGMAVVMTAQSAFRIAKPAPTSGSVLQFHLTDIVGIPSVRVIEG